LHTSHMNLFVAIRVLGDSAITSASGSVMKNDKQQIIRKIKILITN